MPEGTRPVLVFPMSAIFSSLQSTLFSPVHAFLALLGFLLIWCFWLYLYRHSIKIAISSFYLQSEQIKVLCLHSLVPEKLLSLCVFRHCSYFSALLLLNRSLTASTIYCEEKADATLDNFNKSPFYPALLGRSICSKRPIPF